VVKCNRSAGDRMTMTLALLFMFDPSLALGLRIRLWAVSGGGIAHIEVDTWSGSASVLLPSLALFF